MNTMRERVGILRENKIIKLTREIIEDRKTLLESQIVLSNQEKDLHKLEEELIELLAEDFGDERVYIETLESSVKIREEELYVPKSAEGISEQSIKNKVLATYQDQEHKSLISDSILIDQRYYKIFLDHDIIDKSLLEKRVKVSLSIMKDKNKTSLNIDQILSQKKNKEQKEEA